MRPPKGSSYGGAARRRGVAVTTRGNPLSGRAGNLSIVCETFA